MFQLQCGEGGLEAAGVVPGSPPAAARAVFHESNTRTTTTTRLRGGEGGTICMQRHRVTALWVAGDLMESVPAVTGRRRGCTLDKTTQGHTKRQTSMRTYTSIFCTLPLLSESRVIRKCTDLEIIPPAGYLSNQKDTKIEKQNQVTIAAALELSECIYTLYSLG